ncbi:MAG: SAM-dependent chlorinase/fluorinase [Candidatus Thiodiazotropha sp.]
MQLDKAPIPLIASYTDFGSSGPYQGQMHAVIATQAPRVPRVKLMADAPMFDPQSAGILLSCLCNNLPAQTLVLAVVDPGVGGDRRPIMISSDKHCFVGPDNGLFVPEVHHSGHCEIEVIDWRPPHLSNSFHGRDLFAPVAAGLATGKEISGIPIKPNDLVGYDSPIDKNRIIYQDNYGNAMTGIDAGTVGDDNILTVNGTALHHARTFSEVPAGQPFWYRNSIGLVEFAVNRGNASRLLNLEPGMPVRL